MNTDSELASRIFRQLSDDSVDVDRLTIGVRDGIVTLQGVVPSLWQKIEADARTRQIDGVFAIANELVVELPAQHERDDGDIVRDAAHVLFWHSELPKTIQVSASNGWLTLSGEALGPQKREAERAVSSIAGVKGIVNDIDVSQ